MFKSGNVLSSDGRGIVREVRVAVFAVISRHIRRRVFSCSLSLSRSSSSSSCCVITLILMRVVFGWNICCEERDKASFGQLFSGLIFAIFSPFFQFLAIDPPKTLFSLFFRIYERKHFPHLHSTRTRERGEDFREHTREK